MTGKIKYILAALFLAVTINAQSIEVFADTDTTEYMVGDYIHYTLELRYTNDIRVEVPSVIDSISVLDFIREDAPVKQENGKEVYELRKFVFSKYDSAEVTIPGYNISYYVGNEKEVSTIKVNPVTLLVRTIEVDPSGEIQDVKAPLKIELDWLLIALIAVGVIIVLVTIYLVVRHYRNKKNGIVPEKKIIKIPAFRVALESLSTLEDKKLWQQGKIKEYHSEITEIIRKYFEERFKIQALEMTSGELIEAMQNHEHTGEILGITGEFLGNADLVKFAKFEPMPTVNEEMMKQAYDIVNKTKVEEEVKVETVEVQNAE